MVSMCRALPGISAERSAVFLSVHCWCRIVSISNPMKTSCRLRSCYQKQQADIQCAQTAAPQLPAALTGKCPCCRQPEIDLCRLLSGICVRTTPVLYSIIVCDVSVPHKIFKIYMCGTTCVPPSQGCVYVILLLSALAVRIIGTLAGAERYGRYRGYQLQYGLRCMYSTELV